MYLLSNEEKINTEQLFLVRNVQIKNEISEIESIVQLNLYNLLEIKNNFEYLYYELLDPMLIMSLHIKKRDYSLKIRNQLQCDLIIDFVPANVFKCFYLGQVYSEYQSKISHLIIISFSTKFEKEIATSYIQ